MTLWTVSESSPPTIVRNAVCTLEDRSRLEIDGQEAVLLLEFNAAGVCAKTSKLLFPTRYENPNDFRGYLKAPFQFPSAIAPQTISYDGVALKLHYENATGLAYVSPYSPTVWAVIDYDSPQDVAEPFSDVVNTANSHTVYRIQNWVSPTRLEVAYSCEDNVASLSSAKEDFEERTELVRKWTKSFQFECADKEINAAIFFAKIRTSEAVFAAKNLGLVHSPGGGMFYGGVWCNDQAEYAAPLLVLLGESGSHLRNAILNSFRVLAKHFDYDNFTIPYSVEIDGGYVGKLDRGDAAMYAWGLSLVVSALNSEEITNEFFPHVEFCCTLMQKKIMESPDRVFTSDSDELEGRFSTGNANLSVNCLAILAFDAASQAAILASKEDLSVTYKEDAMKLRESVHEFFHVEDSYQYSYYIGCADARGWICLTALAGLRNEKKALKYCLRNLWLSDGVVVTENDDVIWDRCTLYALRAAFLKGLVDEGASRLKEFVESRLIHGVSSPYSIENNKSLAPLSTESALLMRVITEGLLGMSYVQGNVLKLQIRCPVEWKQYSVRNIPYSGSSFHCHVKTVGDNVSVTLQADTNEFNFSGPQGLCINVELTNSEITPSTYL